MNAFPIRRNQHQEYLLRLATKIYSCRGGTESCVLPEKAMSVSDTHDTTPALPHGDVLLHAGNLTKRGSFTELQAQLTWLSAQSHTHKVVVAGNHGLVLDPAIEKRSDKSPTELDWGSIIYLQDRSMTLNFPNGRVLTVYGAPWNPKFGTWAFQHAAKSDVWANTIPPQVDILLTHGPPQCHLDMNTYGGRTGSQRLLRELYRARPRLVVFGHIHEGYGQEIEASIHRRRSGRSFSTRKGGGWTCATGRG